MSLKIVFFSMDLVGPQNACIGLAQALVKRGHRIYFVCRQQGADKFRRHGLECLELIDDVKTAPDVIKDITNHFYEKGFFDDKKPIDKMKLLCEPPDFLYMERDQAICFEPQIRKIVKEMKPDLAVIDAEVIPPSLICQQDFAWVGIFSSNPLGLFHLADLPPFTSGLATNASYRAEWDKYAIELNNGFYKCVRGLQQYVCTKFNCPRDDGQVSRPLSPYLNLYQFPAELDYDDCVTLPSKCLRVDAFIRDDPIELYRVPPEFETAMKNGKKVIYVSMGSMGSYDVQFMTKLVGILRNTPYLYIVSKGQLADQYDLADNMIGESFLPQTRVLPLVDMAIMHGGNNSLTEAIYHAKPMIVMPMFYDQFDNAQRVEEKQFGVQLNPFNFEASQLLEAIERVLNDQSMRTRLRQASHRIEQSQSKETACDRIEHIVKTFASQAI